MSKYVTVSTTNTWDTKYVTVSNTWATKDTVTLYFTKYTLCIGPQRSYLMAGGGPKMVLFGPKIPKHFLHDNIPK